MKLKKALCALVVILLTANPGRVDAAGWSEIAPGVLWYEATVRGAQGPIKVWFYLPKTRSGKLPCVIVPPAGTRMFHGMALGDGDRAEHLPYVRAGFAVVSFEIEGPLAEDASVPQIIAAARAFMAAKGGVVDGKAAIDAISSIKDIDPSQLMAAGHSSAGTTVLALAAAEPRVKACAAFAPCPDVVAHLGTNLKMLNGSIPGFQSFIQAFSPLQNTASVKCPTLVFNASDDDNITPQQVTAYVGALKRTNKNVTVITVPTGGHYDSMIQYGIPAAIKFFRAQPAPAKK